MTLALRVAQKKILGDLGIRIKMQWLHFFDGIHGIMQNHAVTDALIIQHVQNVTVLSLSSIPSPLHAKHKNPAVQHTTGKGKSTPDGTISYGR